MKVYLAQESDYGEWIIHRAFLSKEKALDLINEENRKFGIYKARVEAWRQGPPQKFPDLPVDFINGMNYLTLGELEVEE